MHVRVVRFVHVCASSEDVYASAGGEVCVC